MNNVKKKKVLGDVLLNLVASILPVCVLQFLLLPHVATRMDGEDYGLLLTLVSLMTIVSNTIGNALNNVRLLVNMEYHESRQAGDFNILLVSGCMINAIIIFVGTWIYEGGFRWQSILLTLLASTFWLAQAYFSVGFRLELKYSRVLQQNLLLIIGYGIGTFLFIVTGYWEFIYCCGMGLSSAYTILRTRLLKEPFRTTVYFKKTSYKTLVLILSSALSNILTHVDRLLLFPLLGGTMVSVYYASTLFGKAISLGITPINSVVLSYFSRLKRLKANTFKTMLLASSILGILGFFACLLISRPTLMLLYPQWVDLAMQYIWITTATAMVAMVISVIQPVILKFCNINWQIVINAVCILVYIALSLPLLKQFGLYGFCAGVLVANVVKLFIMVGIYIYSSQKNKGAEEQ